MIEYIDIKEASKVPKYQQIVDSVLSAIGAGQVRTGDKLPSVNELLIEFDISRDTVVRAYDHLKESGIIESVPGKGYYIKNDQLTLKARVFLLFNKLSAHKKIIYDAFSQCLGDRATIDFFATLISLTWYLHARHTFADQRKGPYLSSACYERRNGMSINASNLLASSSVSAVVTIVISRPRTLSISS